MRVPTRAVVGFEVQNRVSAASQGAPRSRILLDWAIGLWWGIARHPRLVYKGKSLLNQYGQECRATDRRHAEETERVD